ncbi:uncharacterized protein METZ01_LOCUS152724 [marine metagenome]|uniref:Uncharacterized protein n=1 Tax=marine metagenome TaxID=408172 RepID=A0A382AE74_9ZZZZ
MIAKNDRTYVLAGSSKARHGSRLITVLPYTVTFLIHYVNLIYFISESYEIRNKKILCHELIRKC